MLRHFHCTATSVAQNSPFLLFLEQFPPVPGLCPSLGSSSPIAGCTPGAQIPAGVLAQPQLSLRSFCAQILLIPHPACRTKAFPRCGILAEVGRGFLTVPEEQKVLWGILVWLCKIPA